MNFTAKTNLKVVRMWEGMKRDIYGSPSRHRRKVHTTLKVEFFLAYSGEDTEVSAGEGFGTSLLTCTSINLIIVCDEEVWADYTSTTGHA